MGTTRAPADRAPTPLGWSLAVLTLVPVLLAILVFSLLKSSLRQQNQLVDQHLRNVVETGELTTSSNQAGRELRDYLLTLDESRLAAMQRHRADVRRLLARDDAKDPQARRLQVAKLREQWDAMSAVMDRVVAKARAAGLTSEVRSMIHEQLLPQRALVDTLEAALTRTDRERSTQARASVDEARSRTFWLLSIGFVALSALSAWLASAALRHLRARERAEQERARLREREQHARREAEERRNLLDLVVEQSGEGVIVADAQGVLRIFNPAAEQQHGVPYAETAAPDWSETYGLLRLDGTTLPLEEMPLYRALQGEVVRDARWKVKRRDGSVRTLRGTAQPLRAHDGSSAGAVVIAHDETVHLELEGQRDDTLAQLDALFESAPLGLAFLDENLRYLRVNAPLAHMNALPAELHAGRTVREVIGEEAAAALEPSLRTVLETGERLTKHELVTSSDGQHERHFMVQFFPVRARTASVRGVGALIVDVTQMKEAEEKMRRAVELRERFIGILSHDLRDPLNAISMSAQLLLHSENVPERALRLVRRVSSSASRISRMITDLLDVTRVRLGEGLNLHAREADLFAITHEVVDELCTSFPDAQVNVETHGSGAGMWDADRITQVVSNLVSNAIQHGAKAAPIRIEVNGRAEETLTLSIHNRGAAIPQELIPQLFEPFRRSSGRRTGSRQGLGLGLYIAQQIVGTHGGSIRVQSCEENGTKFEVELPRELTASSQGVRGELRTLA